MRFLGEVEHSPRLQAEFPFSAGCEAGILPIMCGRYSLTTPSEVIRNLFGLPSRPALFPRYNIAPGQAMLAIRLGRERAPEAFFARWGLVPYWAEDVSIGSRMVNARAETVMEKAAFKHAFRRRRCLIPADGFYEWQTVKGGGGKQPWRIHFTDKEPFAFAGLWEHWQGPDGSELETTTILTTAALPVIAPLHERMPVILNREQFPAWLGEGDETAWKEPLAMLKPYAGPRVISAYPVSTRVNAVGNDDAGLWDVVDPKAGAQMPAKTQLSLF